jgi:hypothetical protein
MTQRFTPAPKARPSIWAVLALLGSSAFAALAVALCSTGYVPG